MSSPFILDDARPITPSEGGLSNESNVEHLSSGQAICVPEEEALYWYGKQVLAFRLASDVIRQAKVDLTSNELDVSDCMPWRGTIMDALINFCSWSYASISQGFPV
jgi:hypothetical protein